ncbi:hypothetical protein [Agromyces tropicus]|uniref:hypothetical protein n=1 Tax=Agromyces tropicus TaxID=555371 RepID=UPI0031E0F078
MSAVPPGAHAIASGTIDPSKPGSGPGNVWPMSSENIVAPDVPSATTSSHSVAQDAAYATPRVRISCSESSRSGGSDRMYARRLPSGDHEGAYSSSSGVEVSCRGTVSPVGRT